MGPHPSANPTWKHLYRRAQGCVSWVIPNPIKLITEICHPRILVFLPTLNREACVCNGKRMVQTPTTAQSAGSRLLSSHPSWGIYITHPKIQGPLKKPMRAGRLFWGGCCHETVSSGRDRVITLMNSWSCSCLHKTCRRTSQETFRHGGSGIHEPLPLTEILR